MFKSVKSASTGLLLLLLLSPLTIQAQQTADASQSSAILLQISSYTASLLKSPAATSIALEVALAASLPDASLVSIASGLPTLLPSLTRNEDLYGFATAPPLTFAEPAWVTGLPAGVRSDVEGLRSSVVRAEASIVAGVLGLKEAVATATATATATGTGTASAAVASATAASGAAVLGKMDAVFLGAVVAGVVAAVAVL